MYDLEAGIALEIPFSSRKPNGQLTADFRNKTTPANPPSFELRRMDGVVIDDNPSGTISVTLNLTPGRHVLNFDGSRNFQATPGYGYQLYCTDGEISDGTNWLDVSGDVPLWFLLRGGAAGFLAQRVIELLEGTVTAVVSSGQFTAEITGRDHSQPPFAGTDLYHRLGVSFQSGNLYGISRNVLRSVTTVSDVNLVMEAAFPIAPEIGDKFALIPEEQVGPIAIAHLSAVPHVGRYGCTWTQNQKEVTPDANTLLTARILDNGSTLFSDVVMQKTTAFGFFYENATTLAPPNSLLELRASAAFNGVIVTGWPRVFPRTA